MGAAPRYYSARVATVSRFGGLAWLRLVLEPGFSHAEPGQFVMLVVHGSEAVPMSIAWLDEHGLELVVRPVGETTRRLYEATRGERLGVIGPLGRGLPRLIGEARGSRVLLLGGGSGVAPILYMAAWLESRGAIVSVALGVRDWREAGIRRVFESHGIEPLVYCEEVGEGCDRGGVVVDPELGLDYDLVVAAGPLGMLSAAYRLYREKLVVVMEALVRCGVGFCGSCRLWEGGPLLCRDGPVFPASMVRRLLEGGVRGEDNG